MIHAPSIVQVLTLGALFGSTLLAAGCSSDPAPVPVTTTVTTRETRTIQPPPVTTTTTTTSDRVDQSH